MPTESTRIPAAALAAKIVAYTALSKPGGSDADLRLSAELQAILERELPGRSGRVVRFVGDNALAVFESPDDAVESALAIRDSFQQSSAAVERGASLRIGIHVGEIVTAPDGDVRGDGVTFASRIQETAEPGQVLVSRSTVERIGHRSDLRTVALGQRQLKGLSRPMELYGVERTAEARVDSPRGAPREAEIGEPDFFSELKRRKVYRVGAAYLAMALAALEGANLVFPTLGLGPGAFNGLVLTSLLGFPLALALAWTFDVTGSGIRRTEPWAVGPPTAASRDRWVRLKASLVGAGFVAVVWIGVRAWQPLGAPPETGVPVEEPTLAVLPLADFSPDGDHAYLSAGLHEEILHQLAQVPGIRLTSRTSSSFMQGVPPKEAAASLGVRYVLESSVRMAQDSLLLTFQLIDTFTDEHIWSEVLGRRYTLEGLFDLQRLLAQRVAAALTGTLASSSAGTLGAPPTNSLEAYNEFLRGLYRESQFDIDGMWAAVDRYERALQLDPEFGRAHGKLALLLAMLNNYGGVTQGELFPRIREHADLAFRFAPNDPSSYLARMAYVWPMEWDWEQARSLFEEALALDPDYVDAIWGLAEWHGVIAGDTERGLELIQRAFRVDPFSPTLHVVRWWILFNGRRFEEGIPDLEAVLAADPSNQNAALNLVTTLALSGRQPEARERMDALLPTIPTPRNPTLAAHLARAGDTTAAREVLRAAVARKASGGSVPASGIAAGYAALGEADQALSWLERSFAEEGGIYYLRNADWDNVAADPRFQDIWDRVGLLGEHPVLR